MKQNRSQRRTFLKLGGAALALVPAAMIPAPAGAAQNAAVRASLKYQNKPEGDKSCASCSLFVPGRTAKDAGGCKVLPGDTEVSPQAYCIAWAKKS